MRAVSVRSRLSLAAALLTLITAPVLIGISAPAAQATPPTIVAIGDSFTAGFGYFGTTSVSEWGLSTLPNCTPGDGVAALNNGCSSNGALNASTPAGVEFSADYGYANNVSWVAQFAHTVGTDAAHFYNFSVSGSTARQWADNSLLLRLSGSSAARKASLELVRDVAPDLVLSTLGGNPTLSRVLFGSGNICTLSWDKYACFADLVREEGTQADLVTIYSRILSQNPSSKILVMLYPQVVPAVTLFSAESLLTAGEALNDAIRAAITTVQATYPGRIAFASKYFNTGLPPGGWSDWSTCHGLSALGRGTDGPSNQATATQIFFTVSRAVTGWCEGTPWVISGDTGIHPNTLGFGAMATAAHTTWTSWTATHSPPVFTAATPDTTEVVGAEIIPYIFTATSTPSASFSLGSGSLPPGLLLSELGVLSGIPTTPGTYTFSVAAGNGIDAAVLTSITMVVSPAPTVSSPAPEPTTSPSPTPTPTPTATPTPSVTETAPPRLPDVQPVNARPVGGGVVLVSSSTAERTPPRAMRNESGSRLGAAPTVSVRVNRPVKLVTGGLPPESMQAVKIKVKGTYVTLGSVRTDAAGQVSLPVFTPTRAGRQVIAVTDSSTGKTRYIRIRTAPRR